MKKFLCIVLVCITALSLCVIASAEPVADDGTFTFEKVEVGGQSTAFTLLEPGAFTMTVTDQMSYKGQRGVVVSGKGYYNLDGNGNTCVLLTGDGADANIEGGLPRACKITWNLRVPKESSVVEFHTGSSTISDEGQWIFEAGTDESILFVDSKKKDQWLSVSYQIPNRTLHDTFLKATTTEEIDGVVFYLDSVTLVDRDGNIVRSNDVDDTKLGGVESIIPDPVYSESISLDTSELEIEVGAKKYLTATILPADVDDKTMTWAVADESIAKVDQAGRVTGVKVGTTTVTVTTNDQSKKSATATITVVKATKTPVGNGESDLSWLIYVGIGVLVVVIAVVAIALGKKKKSKEITEETSE